MMRPGTGAPLARLRNPARLIAAAIRICPIRPSAAVALLWCSCLTALVPAALAAPPPAQLPGPPFPRYDNPADRPLPPCTCENLEELQDQLASAEFGRQAFEEAAANSRAGPGEQAQILAERDAVGKNDPPSIRTSVIAASTDTSTAACAINDSETRRTAPCEEIYRAFRAHEEHHRQICLHYWNNRGKGPVHFQSGREYFLEEALAYQIAVNVYRHALGNILGNSHIEVGFTLEHGQDPSRFDARMTMVLTAAPGSPGHGDHVEWFGKGAMSFSDMVHDPCYAADMSREDVMAARTDDFRVLSFHHEPGAALAYYHCPNGGSFAAPMPALLAERWQQYLLRDAGLEVTSFDGVRGISMLIDAAAQRRLGASAVALLKSALAAAPQPGFPLRTSYPWSPLVGRRIGNGIEVVRLNRGKTSITDPAKMGGRAELYVDDFSPEPNVKVTSDMRLICP